MKRLLIPLFIITVLISGCIGQTEEATTTIITTSTTSTTTMPKLSTKGLSEMVLQLEDLPSNYTLKTRLERVKSDISKEGQELGWKRGYEVTYMRIGETITILGTDVPIDYTNILHQISIYPIENISKVLATIPRESTENTTFDEFSKPNIGDDSKAFRIKVIDEVGTEYTFYQIEFIKMDVYSALYMQGTTTDYELLKDLAREAESKIS